MSVNNKECLICEHPDTQVLFKPMDGAAFTSAQSPSHRAAPSTRICHTCSHVQTTPFSDINKYYESVYQYQSASVEEEDLYNIVDGKSVYRSQHQARCIQSIYDLSRPLKVLDYGCAKATTLRRLVEACPEIDPYVFDVSDAYTDFWNAFVPKQNQFANTNLDELVGRMDLTLAFFSLEHTASPRVFVREVASTLCTGGVAHIVIPNMYENISDLLVADHVNHFSPLSLQHLFESAGFTNLSINTTLHAAAYVVSARKANVPQESVVLPDPEKVKTYAADAERSASMWNLAVERIRAFEKEIVDTPAAIYGSGVYGMFIASILADRSNVRYFIDANPYRQKHLCLGLPIIAPQDVGEEVEAIYVGLNPKAAASIIKETPWLHAKPRRFLFL